MAQKNKISIKIAGAQGQGAGSGGQGLAKVFKRAGLHVFGIFDYMSLIKGGHSFFQLTLSDQEINANTEKFHIVVSFDPQNVQETVGDIHTLQEGGLFIVDDSINLKPEIEAAVNEVGAKLCKIPMIKLGTEIGGNKIMANTVALGAVVGLTGTPFEILENIVAENFAKKSKEIADKNVAVAKAGFDFGSQNLKSEFNFSMPQSNKDKVAGKMLINGNEAIAMGSYAAGCRFFSAYPMTPGTSVFEWFTKDNAKLGVVTKHVEDEIAAVCMAIGAAQVGARAMTSTSGGGFCLMVEGLGLAGITEVPIVVVDAQRGGPSTGLPTRTEQADLLFAVNSSHGEFAKIVLAPGTVEQCYEAGVRAHNLAAKYQTPVIILTDLLMADHLKDSSKEDYYIPEVDLGKVVSKEELDKLGEDEKYLRFKFTEDGVSPRALQGHPKSVHAPATDEHDETGHITEDASNRLQMMEKRMKKLESAVNDIKGPEFHGPENADLTLIVWGSTYGAALEAVQLFNSDEANKQKINLLHFTEVWPFPVKLTEEALKKVKLSMSVEQNYTSQFCKLLRAETGYVPNKLINKYDGRQITPEEIVREVQKLLSESLVAA
ncbi:MAG: 2-oxoacid:acceptor oxidoreductase subunit alpha [Candidatus Caenarcaniphilales bacterium]|nr:2-oxoacid:acceptor oxidoreductase subunit alpha [Candidatus Caenarcaniphilales bacterium]